ncbi:S41 family peptidase [Chitinophaga sp. 22536]|uniref:S41 family peptidase n=1 Tax=unclassified Chitinophaga TaxID=2619133 RepID=UPI003F8295F2
MHYSPLLKRGWLLCFVFFFVPVLVVAQQSYRFTQQGWRPLVYQGDRYELKTAADDTVQLKYGSISRSRAIDSLSWLNNVFFLDSVVTKGAIVLTCEFKTDSLTDANDAGISIQGSQNDQPPFVFRNLSLESIKGRDTVNYVYLVIPFETPINKIVGFVYLKKPGSVQVKNLKITVTKGEFDPVWKSTYAEKVKSDSLLIKKIALFVKVWGFLKYYAASISEKKVDWDDVFIKYIPAVFGTGDTDGLKKQLNDLIVASQTGKLGKISPVNAFSAAQLINCDDSWLYKSTLLPKQVRGKLLNLKENFRAFDNYYVSVGDNDFAPNPKFQHEKPYSMYELPDMRYRLLMLARYWNIIQYYYPYKYAMGSSWDKVLEEYIPAFITATSRNAYVATALRLNTEINDGHAALVAGVNNLVFWTAVYGNGKLAVLPVQLNVMDSNRVVVSQIDTGFSRNTGIKAGDKILAINNQQISAYVSNLVNYIGGGRINMKYHYISRSNLLTGICLASDSLSLKYMTKDDSTGMATQMISPAFYKNYASFIGKNMMGPILEEAADPAVRMLSDSILYVDAARYSQKDTTQFMLLFPLAKKAIIDFRKYPSLDALRITAYFIPQETHYVNFMYPGTHPGILEKKVEGRTAGNKLPLFQGELALLIDEGTQSRGEFNTMMFQAYKHVRLFGRTTAGADGNVSFIPGIGIEGFTFSGVRITYPDNSETQRTGIKPDVEVPLSLQEVLGKRDVILQTAIQYLTK